jgi:hypothetical protein
MYKTEIALKCTRWHSPWSGKQLYWMINSKQKRPVFFIVQWWILHIKFLLFLCKTITFKVKAYYLSDTHENKIKSNA